MSIVIDDRRFYETEEVTKISTAFVRWIVIEKFLNRTYMGEPMWTDLSGNRYHTNDLFKHFVASLQKRAVQ
jgi:hypothetical protein